MHEQFTLRKISLKEITRKYFSGELSRKTPPIEKIKTVDTGIRIGREVGNNLHSETYRFADRQNGNQTILTTNHNLYNYYNELSKGNNPELPLIKCKYCKRTIKNTPVGIPIMMEIDEQNDTTTYYIIDPCCDFGCSFTLLKKKTGDSRIYRDGKYMNGEQMLYCMYYQMHPEKHGKSLQEKPDWEMLRENGGLMTDEEFDSETMTYVPLPSLIILPTKGQVLRMNTKNVRD